MRAGFDFHGVLDTETVRYASFIEQLIKGGHQVHIITGHEDTLEFRKHLSVLKLNWTHLFSIISFHKLKGEKIKYDANGNPWMDKALWDVSKAEYCKKNNISFLIDDSDVYGSTFMGLNTLYLKYSKGKLDAVNKPIDEATLKLLGPLYYG